MKKSTVAALSTARVASSHVDWITTTTSTHEASARLWDVGQQRLSAGELEGQLPTRWHGHGYRGWASPHVALGARADGCYLRLSGPESAQHWIHALTAAENCTRLDLAVDAHLNSPVASLVRELYQKSGNRLAHGGRPPMKRLTMDTNGGQTLYLGSRTSERFARLYDKGREQRTLAAGLWWRFELELKQRAAESVGAALLRRGSAGAIVRRLVAGFFHQRVGITIAALRRGEIHNLALEPTTADRQLHWLASGVRPAVARLVKHYGRERVLHVLGLSLHSAVDGPPPHTKARDGQCLPV